jgi:hypothetical protein
VHNWILPLYSKLVGQVSQVILAQGGLTQFRADDIRARFDGFSGPIIAI